MDGLPIRPTVAAVGAVVDRLPIRPTGLTGSPLLTLRVRIEEAGLISPLILVSDWLTISRFLPARDLPPYSYVSGKFPHPQRDPRGHSYKLVHQAVAAPTDLDWRQCEAYVWGIDLFNCGYYWEAHESWEQVWHACQRRGATADFIKGLIKLAAAGVKAREGRIAGVRRHAGRARELFQQAATAAAPQRAFLGLQLDSLLAAASSLCEQPETIVDTGDAAVVRVMPFDLSAEGSP